MLAVTAEAWAERATVRDKRGDALASWDITKVVVENGRRNLTVRVVHAGRLRPDLPPGLLTAIDLDLGASDSVFSPDFEVSLLRESTHLQAPSKVILTDSEFERVRCPSLRGRSRSRRGVVTFVVPQSCFATKAGRVRIRGYTYRVKGAAREADYLDEWSRWIARGPASHKPAERIAAARGP
jgi:hypothetical protein